MVAKFDEKSCGLVLFSEDKGQKVFLLLHYPGGHWDLPKGHVEKYEDEKQTALRELNEETGINDARIFDAFRDEIFYTYKLKGRTSNKQVIFFLAETKQKNIKLSHEHKGYAWLGFEDAYKKATFDNAKELIKKAKEFLEGGSGEAAAELNSG